MGHISVWVCPECLPLARSGFRIGIRESLCICLERTSFSLLRSATLRLGSDILTCVVSGSHVCISEYCVRLRDLHKHILCLLLTLGILIWMPQQCEAPVSFFEYLQGGIASHLEDSIV